MSEAATVLDLCPSCGEFADLREDTGFCNECSPGHFCARCGQAFSPDYQRRTHCSSCRYDIWLEENADELEEVMMRGKSFYDAKKIVQERHKPRCVGCGSQIPKGRLCRKKDCHSVRIRTRHNVRDRGMSPDEALREAIEKVYGRILCLIPR